MVEPATALPSPKDVSNILIKNQLEATPLPKDDLGVTFSRGRRALGLGFRPEISRALRGDMISSDGESNQIVSNVESGGLSRVDRNYVT